MPYIGQEMIGKFKTSNGKNTRVDLVFPHGIVTEVTDKGFKVKFYEYFKDMEWNYRNEDLGRIVYEKERQAEEKNAEAIDRMMENQRPGIEE